MLDEALLDQLRTVFTPIESKIDLVFDESSHQDQNDLLTLINSVASTNYKISVISSKATSNIPRFCIHRNGKATGVRFSGIPTGHEFTSLVLAILNTDGKGKLPDKVTSQRIKLLKGPIRIRTYISLTCETCPEVVQALNQMALAHNDFHHEMIDGGYAPDDIARLGIQGVPSVIVDDKLLHSGKISFLDLLTKIETKFGILPSEGPVESEDFGVFDMIVVGGGPAGVAAAIYTARKGLKTAVVAERIGGQVQDTKGIENLISVTYTEGPQLSSQLYQHMAEYPIRVLDQQRVSRLIPGKTHSLELVGGSKISAKQVIVATGARWRELNIPGEKEYMGKGVAFCPHCDGPFYKGKKVAVIGGGNSGVEAAIDLAGIVREVVLVEYNDTLKADQVLVNKLNSLSNVSVITNAQTSDIRGANEKVTTLGYINRKTQAAESLQIDGVFIQIGLVPNSQFLKENIELSKFGEIIVDGKGRTSVEGIYAAGDVTTTPYKQIIISMGEGAKTALAAFEDRIRTEA
jgi:NADH-dependent peroxiredoxin subunit F